MVYSLNPLPFPRTKTLFRDSLKMILYRIASSSVLHLYKLSSSSSSNFLSGITVPYSLFSISSSSILCSSASLRDHLLWQTKLRQPQARALTTCTSVAQRKGGGDTFFAEESVSWSSIGVSDKLSRSLFNAALGQPSIVQASSIPSILSGKDVVIAAETGSGKTHGYLVPLIEKLYNDHKDDDLEDENGSSEQRLFPIHHKFSLVLCPNVTLCEQVVRMANCLRGDDGKPLLTVAAVCGRQGWPVNKPDIIVSTPVALLNHIEPKKQRCTEFMRGVKYVVFDEADMLLCGSFQNKVIRLIHLLRFDEKKLSWSKESDSHLQTGLESEPSLNFSSEDEQNSEIDGFMEGEEISEGASSGSLGDDDEAGSIKRIDGWKVRKNYKRSKQYIFVAATLPVNGKKTAGAVLKKMFPEANWVSGNYLHCHNPRLKHRWVEVNVDTQVDELLKAVKEGLKSKSVNFDDCQCRTMVFANTVEAVEAVAKILERAGVECYRFHKDCTLEERGKTLNDFGEKGGILVCTDAAARGVDIPNISHVIQADFATSAVDFLHRVGRTGRAGQYGLVTSLYTESNRDLVAAVRSAEEVSQPVEIAFSRKRSFRNKIKKRGYGTVKDTSRVEESVVAY